MAKLAIAIGGAIIGSFFGMPQLGFLIGGIIGGIAFPGKGPTQEGPRLSDLRVQASTYGVYINVGYGTVRAAGNIIDSSGLIEHKKTTKQSAKGAPSSTTITYSYTSTFAVAFCEGVGDIMKVWADGKIIYDVTGASKIDAVKGLTVRFYRGDETQLADSALTALRGTGNVPGYRGLIYAVFEDMDLTNFGNRIPNITAEITFNKSIVPQTFSCDTTPSGGSGIMAALGYAANRNEFIVFAGGGLPSEARLCRINADTGVLVSTVVDPTGGIEAWQGASCCDLDGYIYAGNGSDGYLRKYDRDTVSVLKNSGYPGGLGNAPRFMFYHKSATQRETVFSFINTPGQVAGFTIDNRNPGGANDLVFDGKALLFADGTNTASDTRVGGLVDNDENLWAFGIKAAVGVSNYGDAGLLKNALSAGHSNITGWYQGSTWFTISGAVYGQPIAMWYCAADSSLVFLTAVGNLIKWDMATQTIIASNNISAYVGSSPSSNASIQWQHLGVDTNGLFYFEGSDGHTIYAFDTASLAQVGAYDVRTIFSNPAYAVDSTKAYDPVTRTVMFATGAFTGGAMNMHFMRVNPTGNGGSLGDIVSDICQRCQLSPSQFDVSQLTQTVDGYLLNNSTTGRAAIEALAQLYLFGGVESDFKIKFVPGSQSSVFSVAEDDLMNVEKGIRMIENRMQELDLPLAVTVTYLDKDKDYQSGTQRSQRFGTTESVDTTAISVPVAANADTAKQLSEKVLYLIWTQRNSYQFNTLPKWMLLDALDVGTFSYKGNVFTVKLTKGTLGLAFQMAFDAVSDDTTVYASTSTTDGGQADHTVSVSDVPYSELNILDTPLLQDLDENDTLTGFYFFCTPRGTGTWPGAVLEQSVDDADYNELMAAVVQPTWGYVNGALAAPRSPWSPDRINTLTVRLVNGTLAGVTDLNLVNGSNSALLGTQGRWEMIQFRDVVNNGDGTWTLSYLLRGRRGTEVNCGNHAAGDLFILLATDGSIERVTMATSLLNASRYYKAVTVGDTVADATSQTYSQAGNDLKPYAPCQITGNLSGSDWTIGWLRRTRYGGEWLDGTGDTPLNESTQAYVVEITDSGGVVKRTISAITNRATYTAAMQTVDFGSTQSSLYVNVYQVSSVVGNGFKASAHITQSATLPPVDTVGAQQLFLVNGS